MKHLKSFTIFENKGESHLNDIKDILLEVEDMGLYTDVRYIGSDDVNLERKESVIKIDIEHNPPIDDYSDPFQFADIKDCVERLIEYMKGIGHNDFVYTDIYTEFNFNPNRGEMDNLKRELDYYVMYEPDNTTDMDKISKKLNSLFEYMDGEPNILPHDEDMISVIRLTFYK